MNNTNQITMNRRSPKSVEIDIEGVIGIPENWQFDDDDQRVATYEKFRNTVSSIKAIDAENVKVNIRSKGGNVEDALLIYEALCSLSAQVETICHGYVASAATVIAQAGDVRKITTGTLYLVHRATMVVDGNSTDIMQASALLGKTDERIAQIYADRSGLPTEEFRELMSRDAGRGEWLSPEEVIAAGLADEVVSSSGFSKWSRRIKELLNPSVKIENFVVDTPENSLPELRFEMTPQQKQAKATLTLPKEDPQLGALESKQPGNMGSYSEDAEVFKSMVV